MTDDDLSDFRRWCYAVARDLIAAHRTALDIDDVAQEGLIAMWRARDTFDATKGAWATYGTTAARLRMRDVVVKHRPQFGEGDGKPGPNGRQGDTVPLDDAVHDRPVPAHDETVLTRLVVLAAVRDLPEPDRALVHRRYWECEPATSVERAAWSSRIRPALSLLLDAA
jgi:DNA-directed RNA polymerase specialized sigma24 family protein